MSALEALGSITAPGGFYPKEIRFFLGAAAFLLSCLSSLFAIETVRPCPIIPLSNL
jgi:hypothetical protein